jgi:hypothetical protein
MATFEEQLATAMVAKLAGSTLKEVDNNTVQQSSSGPAVKLDPVSFITAIKDRQQQQQQAQVQHANDLAAQMYPHVSPVAAPMPPPAVLQDTFMATAANNDDQLTFDYFLKQNPNSAVKQFDTIISILEKIDSKLSLLVKQKNKL